MRVEYWRVGILAYRWCKGSSIALSMLKLVLHQPNSSLGTLWISIEAFMFTWSNLRRVRMIPKVIQIIGIGATKCWPNRLSY
eukprot:scaffold10134_cov169-Ochromonas_danica.AAC.1